MSTGYPLIDMAGQAGDALGRGLMGFQQGREAKRKSRSEEALAAFAAGDHARALQLAKEADAVHGLAGPLSPPREAPQLKGTMTTQPGSPIGDVPSPRGLAAMMPEAATPTPRFGLETNQGIAAGFPSSLTPPPAEPNQGLRGLAAYQPTAAPVTIEDRSRPDWNDAGNIEAGRKYVGAPAPKPEYFELGAGQQRYSQLPGQAPKLVATGPDRPAPATGRPVQNPVTGEWFTPAPGMKTDVRPQREGDGPRPVQNPVTGEWFVPSAGMKTDPPPRMVAITNPDGSVTMTPVGAGAPVAQKPIPKPDTFDAGKAARDAVAIYPDDKRGRASKMVQRKREAYVQAEREKADAALSEWTRRTGGGGGAQNPNPPGGGKAAAARRGVLNIAPPSKYEDTALLPEWEGHVQAALKVAPGVEISSRARSKARNAQAKPGGGAPDSWHMHRQAFDVIKYTEPQKAKLRAWAASEGLHMIDEGNHLHFQPARVSDAGQAPALVAFYERHGIKPGADNA